MCGIAGSWSFAGAPPDRHVLADMAAALARRGPDGEGIEVIDGVGLAHRRLAIIDLAGGGQPMGTADDALWVTFNGEIYNYLELRDELVAAGAQFRTQSDTEVILELYARRGRAGLAALRGMFAFALYDRRERTLVLARDRFGIKPLYYQLDARGVVFASEPKALLRHPWVERRLDPTAVSDYLTFLYVPGDRCIFAGVQKVPPASLVVIRDGTARTEQYWDLPFHAGEPESRPAAAWVEQVRAVLEESVALHMRSDVPYAALLSGGIDSSTIVALMARRSSRRVRTYAIGFAEQEFNELPAARRVAEHLGTDHHELILAPDGAAVLPELVRQFDEPFADESALPCFHITRAVGHDVKVCLSGDGGDELFGGYDAYRVALRLDRVDAIPLAVRGPLVRAVTARYPRWVPGLGLLRCAGLSAADRYGELMCGFNPDDKRRLLRPAFARQVTREAQERIRDAMAAVAGLDRVTQLQAVDYRTYLPDDILVKSDRTSMRHALELRVPLIDHVVVEAVAGLPASLKVQGAVGKVLLRRIAATLLPDDIAALPKRGFGVPLRRWLGGELAGLAADVFNDPRTAQRGIFERAELLGLLADHRRGWRDLTHEVWSTLVFELWCREYLDPAPTTRSREEAFP